MQEIATRMVINESSLIKPAPIIESKAGLRDVRTGEIIQIGKKPYRVTRSDIKTKTKDNIKLTTQFIYVKNVTANAVFNAILNALTPAET